MRSVAVALFLVLALALDLACQSTPSKGARVVDAGPTRLGARSTVVDVLTYASGTSGTVTVPAGVFVTGVNAHATSAGSVTITPSGPAISAPVTGSAVPIPAGTSFELEYPRILGQANELGAGTAFIFTGTDSYFVTYFATP